MIFQYASNKKITFDKLPQPEKKEIKIMKAETLFRINLLYLPNPPPKYSTTFFGKAEFIILICLRLRGPIDL